MQEDNVQTLLHRIAEGDEAALAALYDSWAQRVHTLAYWILKDEDEAEDVVEETFWQLWRTADRWNPERSAGSTWLMMIARSRTLDRLRSRRRRAQWATAASTSSRLLEQAEERHEVPGTSPETAERNTVLAAALSVLPVEQREAVELAFLGGLSHAEIAARTAQPLGTVKTRIRLAMQKLRERLASLREEG